MFSKWVCKCQAVSAETRIPVVQNRTGWTADASRDDRCPPSITGIRSSGLGLNNRLGLA